MCFRRLVFVFVALITIGGCQTALGQTGQWTWLGGPQDPPQGQVFPVYGTKGVADAANTPALRSQSLTWTDAQGNLWLLGGNGNPADKPYDLWKFSAAVGKWAWMAGPSTTVCTSFPCTGEVNYGTLGVADPSLYPSSRQEPVSFTGSDGSLWLFGGLGKDSRGTSGYLNDLWRFDTAQNAWAWVGGSNTVSCGSTYPIACGVSAVYGHERRRRKIEYTRRDVGAGRMEHPRREAVALRGIRH